MVRKDGDTMKECMKENNPTEFRDADLKDQKTATNLYEKYGISADVRFNKPIDAYEIEQNIKPDADLSDSQGNPCVKEEFEFDAKTHACWYPGKVVNTSYNVNLRAHADMESPVISHIHPDSEFWISAIRAADWYKVRLKDGTEGYASSKFVARVMPDEHT